MNSVGPKTELGSHPSPSVKKTDVYFRCVWVILLQASVSLLSHLDGRLSKWKFALFENVRKLLLNVKQNTEAWILFDLNAICSSAVRSIIYVNHWSNRWKRPGERRAAWASPGVEASKLMRSTLLTDGKASISQLANRQTRCPYLCRAILSFLLSFQRKLWLHKIFSFSNSKQPVKIIHQRILKSAFYDEYLDLLLESNEYFLIFLLFYPDNLFDCCCNVFVFL